jgi:hypothetical protein
MMNYEEHDRHKRDEREATIVAVFPSRAEARSAIASLHKEKYTHTWLGTTSVAEAAGGDETLTVESGGFFAGSQSLVDALVSHGASGDIARRLEGQIEPGYAIVTINPKDKDVAPVVDIVKEHGGRLGNDAMSDDWSDWTAAKQSYLADSLDADEIEELVFLRR